MNQEHFQSLASVIGQCGVSAQEAGEALKSLANTMKFTIGKPLDIPENKEFYNGEILCDLETSACYVYNNGEFITISEGATMKANYENKIEQQPASGNLNMSLYDLNKAAIGQLPTFGKEDEAAAIVRLNEFAQDSATPHYYMLLCKELSYYTVFHKHFLQGDENFGEAVIDCLHYVGDIKSIDFTDDRTAMEIWVVTPEGEGHVMYLFNYDQGVVLCR